MIPPDGLQPCITRSGSGVMTLIKKLCFITNSSITHSPELDIFITEGVDSHGSEKRMGSKKSRESILYKDVVADGGLTEVFCAITDIKEKHRKMPLWWIRL